MRRFVESMAFQPPSPSYRSTEPSYCSASGGSLIPFFSFAARDPSVTRYLLYSHGNAEDIGHVRGWAKTLASQLNIHVYVYDYTGYGHNGRHGECSEEATLQNIRDMFKYIRRIAPAKDIYLYGQSLGTGPTVHLAAELALRGINVGGVILISPFLSAVASQHYWLSYLPFTDIFTNYSKIGLINSSILIIHGDQDTVVPYSNALELVQRCRYNGTARVRLWRVIDAGHNNLTTAYSYDLTSQIADFIEFTLTGKGDPDCPVCHSVTTPIEYTVRNISLR